MKTCKVCLKHLNLSEFHACKTIKDGFRNECKKCTSLYWKLKNFNNRKDYKVYLIKSKSDDQVIYVGCTSQTLHKRLRDHLGDSKFERGKVYMELVQDEMTEVQALALEQMMIEQLKPSENVYSGYKIRVKKPDFKGRDAKWCKAIGDSNSTPIICLNNGKTYQSIRKASQELGLTESKVCLVCQGKRPHTKGFKFSYL